MNILTEDGHSEFETSNFIIQIIEDDLNNKKIDKVVTRFPPEPNGFLHLGHAKSIFLNFHVAKKFNGDCHLRFDDTNPLTENIVYINSIMEDLRWLGCDWNNQLFFASDYFGELYNMAVSLIMNGLAYVDEQTEETIHLNRGNINIPGIDSPYRCRSIEDNLKYFQLMKEGKYKDGEAVLRAKIDMSHGNMNMRDPLLYRVRHHSHPRTGDQWCIYPFYDFAHGQCDSLEKITHSLCTLEFENHRPLYEWFQTNLDIQKSRQIEFSRLECTHTVLSKRKLLTLVENQYVNGWDDASLPTLSGLRRKGIPPEAIMNFCKLLGIAKRESLVSFSLLETCAMRVLNPIAHRRNVILNPVLVVIRNLDNNSKMKYSIPNHPDNPNMGNREITFSSQIYIDRSDFRINPEIKFFRLSPNKEVRLRYGYWIKCVSYDLDDKGEVQTIYCTYDPETANGCSPPDGRKVKGTIQWISHEDKMNIDVLMYGKLLTEPTLDNLSENEPWTNLVNSNLQKIHAFGEKSLSHAKHPYFNGEYYQFERIGYFVADYNSSPELPIFNLTVPLKDSWIIQNDQTSDQAKRKQDDKLAREKAALARKLKKEAKSQKNDKIASDATILLD